MSIRLSVNVWTVVVLGLGGVLGDAAAQTSRPVPGSIEDLYEAFSVDFERLNELSRSSADRMVEKLDQIAELRREYDQAPSGSRFHALLGDSIRCLSTQMAEARYGELLELKRIRDAAAQRADAILRSLGKSKRQEAAQEVIRRIARMDSLILVKETEAKNLAVILKYGDVSDPSQRSFLERQLRDVERARRRTEQVYKTRYEKLLRDVSDPRVYESWQTTVARIKDELLKRYGWIDQDMSYLETWAKIRRWTLERIRNTRGLASALARFRELLVQENQRAPIRNQGNEILIAVGGGEYDPTPEIPDLPSDQTSPGLPDDISPSAPQDADALINQVLER